MNAEFSIGGAVLESERLILRPFCGSDLDGLFEYASVPGVGEMAGWSHHKSIDETERILRSFIEKDKTFAITERATGKLIGSLGVEEYGLLDKLTEFDGYLGRELGYVLSRDFWGRGLMTEALRTVIDYLFFTVGLDFLLCGHYDKNERSKRVQEKCGFLPYRRLTFDTQLGTREPGVLNLLTNPDKNIRFKFSHPETLIYEGDSAIE